MTDEPLLDGTRTSADWAKARPALCVLPIGAFEQHSHHLPLCSDNFEAEYFGRFLARELRAALLPTLNYGTSLEQTGFAGTVTLKPETLMQVLRDIAEEVQTQGFKTMIVVSGHGGNYCIGPAVRDINRRNGPLKILLVEFWTFADAAILETSARGLPDIHSGEFETSLMLALKPEWVGPERIDMDGPIAAWKQSDLNTFGMGFFAPSGAPGYPSLASREKGLRLLQCIQHKMLHHVRERLQWLEKDRTYAGRTRSDGSDAQ